MAKKFCKDAPTVTKKFIAASAILGIIMFLLWYSSIMGLR
jgi:hypothetical protein